MSSKQSTISASNNPKVTRSSNTHEISNNQWEQSPKHVNKNVRRPKKERNKNKNSSDSNLTKRNNNWRSRF